MIKLPQFKTNEKGQILVIFLLVLVVGLALALSIASRTVTDIRQTTTSDDSNRAYFAAEAGVENALKKIEQDAGYAANPTATPNASDVSFEAVNSAKADVEVDVLSVPPGTVFEFPNLVAKDEISQVNLLTDFYNAGGGSPFGLGDTLNIYWDEASIGGYTPAPESAVEISVITCSSATCGAANPTFNIYKMAFDLNAASHTNNFCTTNISAGDYQKDTNLGNNYHYRNRATVVFNSPVCNNDQVPAGQTLVLARVRLLYNNKPIRVAVESPANKLPRQGHKIESAGSTASNVTRKLAVTRLYPSLPAIFDYVLFNGSTNNALSKP